MNIFYNGDVNPCCGDIDGELVLGNIRDLSIKELWYGKKINRIRKMMTNRVIEELPVCMGCDGCSKEWHSRALSQLKEVYHKLDPDIHVGGLSASTPVLFRHSTGQMWK
jgi:radical SAM protein with 4Fe4S-binding SPASM domain